jgi:hypothetical protein
MTQEEALKDYDANWSDLLTFHDYLGMQEQRRAYNRIALGNERVGGVQ